MTFLKRQMISLKYLLISIFFIILFATVCLVVFISSQEYRRTTLETLSSSRADILRQASEKVVNICNSASILSNLYYYHDTLDQIVETHPAYLTEELSYEYFIKLKEMNQSYRSALINTQLTYYCIFMADNGFNYISLSKQDSYDFEKFRLTDWYSTVLEANGKIVVISGFTDTLSDGTEKNCLVFARLVKNTINKPSGLLLIMLDESVLHQSYDTISSNSEVSIITRNGEIISNNQKSLIGTTFSYNQNLSDDPEQGYYVTSEKNSQLLITYCFIPDTDLIIVEKMPLKFLLAPLHETSLAAAALCLFVFIFVFVIYMWITDMTIKPLHQLCSNFSSIGRGDFDITFEQGGWKEVNEIRTAAQQMTLKIKELIETVKREEALKREAELNFLQAQINPHFIHNTIFSAKCLVDIGEYQAASNMITTFCTLLHNMFQKCDPIVGVYDELPILRDYIRIMQYRYDNFDVVYEIEPSTEKIPILRMILQPIIENAIFHGIGPCEQRCILYIRMYLEKNSKDFVIEIEDTGIGMTEETLRHLYDYTTSQSIGIRNVRDRLFLYYGDSVSMNVYSAPKHGTLFKIRRSLNLTEEISNENINCR